MARIPRVLQGLLIANVLLYLLASLVPGWTTPMRDALMLAYPSHPDFRIWQFLTSVFMHASISHLFFNMFALVSFGTPLAAIWGPRRFLAFYLVAGVGAALIYTGVQWYHHQALFHELVAAGVPAPVITTMLDRELSSSVLRTPALRHAFDELQMVHFTKMLGASGAVYGILVAFGFSFPNAKLSLMFLPVPVAAKYFIPILVGIDLLSGVTGVSIFGGGVAHFAHVGGALIGFVFMLAWRHVSAPRPFVS